MRKYFNKWSLLGAAVAFLIWLAAVPSSTLAGIIQAIIPAAVPTANKQGNGSKFQLAGTVAGTGATLCTDASGNATTTGCTAGGGAAGATLFSSTTQAGPSNSAAETTLIGTVTGATTIAANTFTDGALLEVVTEGYYSLPVAPSSLTLNLKCGSTVLATGSATAISTITNGSFRMWLAVTAIGSGAGGAFMTNGLVQFSGGSFAPPQIKLLNTSNVAFDFTTACVMDVTAQWGAAQVGQSITGTNVAAWIPGAPVTSVNGGTGAILTSTAGTFANLPSCTPSNNGALYIFTNSFYASAQCNGATWTYLGASGAMTPPVLGNFPTTVNAPTTVTTNGGIQMTAPGHSGDLYRMVCKALPATPYTIDASLTSPNPATQYLPIGLALYDSSTTAFVIIAQYTDCNGTTGCISNSNTSTVANGPKTIKFTNPTTFSAYYNSSVGWGTQQGPILTFRVTDDGANRTMGYALDCCNFITLTTVGNTDFTTPDKVCLAVDSGNVSVASSAWWIHYLEH